MSTNDWEPEISYIPPAIIPAVVANKWDGEDEEDNVKESWEDEEEEKKRDEQAQRKVPSSQSKKPKSRLQEKIEEREKREQEYMKGNLRDPEDPDFPNMTADQIHAEKLRRQKLEEEADLEVAKEMLGISDEEDASVDKIHPKTKEEFMLLEETLMKKILNYKTSEHFTFFSEELIRNLCANLSCADLKKLKLTIDNMYNEKVKSEKTKGKPKGKSKATLRLDGNNLYDEYSAYTVDEYDDFM